MQGKTVAAISSFVMRGAVGLRATAFALERRGARVWPVPTILLPWHPGMGPSTRVVPDAFPTQLGELASRAQDLDAVLTGYFANAEQVYATAHFIDAVRKKRPDCVMAIDPVTGDEGGRYVPDAVAEAIQNELLPRADITTPNANELRDLAKGGPLEEAARRMNVPVVVVTSAVDTPERSGAMLVTKDRVIVAEHDALRPAPRGTGDLFGAVFLSATLGGEEPSLALQKAAAATLSVLRVSDVEALALAAGQDAIASPPVDLVEVSQVPNTMDGMTK